MPIGWAGRLHPALSESLDLPEGVLLFELTAESVLQRPVPVAHEMSEFPSSRRDFSVIVADALPVQALLDVAAGVPEIPLVDALAFDVYAGSAIGTGFKSVAIGLIFNDYSRTLTSEEVDRYAASVLAAWQSECGASVRE